MQMIDHEERFWEKPPLQLNLANLLELFVMGTIWGKPAPTIKFGGFLGIARHGEGLGETYPYDENRKYSVSQVSEGQNYLMNKGLEPIA
ncbi:hypothetical protein OOK60_18500 [Trichothermofontia sichuanensis B231]|uniref:hypothetical protein n=1 Tax=Trichothermofontia sichuanensis TaxID=3045816 RepID=UPI0022466B99|nr:hypothetical protein [Trichothermofontia sichuanensis]UZQ54432.1 hypothetical protein OOK60_18500 [Trichothermofontia sichuanensis B231]